MQQFFEKRYKNDKLLFFDTYHSVAGVGILNPQSSISLGALGIKRMIRAARR